MERSVISEMVKLLQLMGALSIEWTHSRSAVGSGGNGSSDAHLPSVHVVEHVGWFTTALSSISSAWHDCTHETTAASAEHDAREAAHVSKTASTLPSPLSGRVLHRLNARPPIDSPEAFLSSLSPTDFYHTRRSGAMQDQVLLRLSRGIVMAGAFSLHHATPDSSTLPGTRKLQLESVPQGCAIRRVDEIVAGFSFVGRGAWETHFRVLYPECV